MFAPPATACLPHWTLSSKYPRVQSTTRPDEGKEGANAIIFKETYSWKWTQKRLKVKVGLVVIRVKCCPSRQWGGADLTAAFLTLGAHEWPGCLAAGWTSLHRLHAIVSVSPGVLERLFVLCSCRKVKETQGAKHPLAPKVPKVYGELGMKEASALASEWTESYTESKKKCVRGWEGRRRKMQRSDRKPDYKSA